MKLIRIKQLSQKRNGGLTKVAADIGMNVSNLHRCVNINDMKASDLERVAQIFGVPVSYFLMTRRRPSHSTRLPKRVVMFIHPPQKHPPIIFHTKSCKPK